MSGSVFDANVLGILGVLAAAAAIAFIRLARGPSLADRVVALDLIAITGVAFGCAIAIHDESPWPIDVALLLALVGFLSTVAFSRYITGRGTGRGKPPEEP